MPTYILLSTLTPEGRQTLHKNPDRLDEVNKEIEEFGCKVLGQYAVLGARVARSPAPNYPKPPRPGSLAPNVGDHGPSDSALAAASGWRLHRLAADRHAARCASRDLCSGARHSAPCALESRAEKTSRVIARQRCPKVIVPLANANCSDVEAIVGVRWRIDCARQLKRR